MALALITKSETRIDCTDVKAGDPVATLDTELDVDTIAEILSLGQLGIDGTDLIVVDAEYIAQHGDAPVGKISTEHPRGNIASLMKSGMLIAVEMDELQPSARKKVEPKKKKAKTPTEQPPSPTTDPTDEDLDDDSEEDELSGDSGSTIPARSASDGSAPPQAEATKPADEITIDPSLDGLPLRIQKVLTVRGLGTKAAITAYIAEGKKLDDVEDIGPKAAAQIQSWLA